MVRTTQTEAVLRLPQPPYMRTPQPSSHAAMRELFDVGTNVVFPVSKALLERLPPSTVLGLVFVELVVVVVIVDRRVGLHLLVHSLVAQGVVHVGDAV